MNIFYCLILVFFSCRQLFPNLGCSHSIWK
jgi:hypothetical protein